MKSFCLVAVGVVLFASFRAEGSGKRKAGIALTLVGSALTVGGTACLVTGAGSLDNNGRENSNPALRGSGAAAIILGQALVITGAALWGTSGRGAVLDPSPDATLLRERRRRRIFVGGLVLTGVGGTGFLSGIALLSVGAGESGWGQQLFYVGGGVAMGMGFVLLLIGVPMAITARPRHAIPRIGIGPLPGGAQATAAVDF